MTFCDRHWSAADVTNEEYQQLWAAEYELSDRGLEVIGWARSLLTHANHDANACGAFLLGELGSRGQLGDAANVVIAELGGLIRRILREGYREPHALNAAVASLGSIGSTACVPFLRSVLLSDDEYLPGETAWCAAEAIEQVVGQPFMKANDPVGAAQAYLRARTG